MMVLSLRPLASVTTLLGLSLVAFPRLARAEGPSTKAECAAAYEQAQELRTNGKLREAHKNLGTCSQDSCPSFIKTDCSQWLGEVEQELPTIMISAKDQSGEDTTAVSVTIDGELVASELDGKAIEVDPGVHKLRFEIQGAHAVEQKLVVRQGEKERAVSVSFAAAAPEPPVDDASPYAGGAAPDQGAPRDEPSKDTEARGRPGSMRPYAYVAGGIGAAGIASFAIFGALGHSAKSDLDASGCKPHCSQSDVDSIKTKYVLADVSLGIGVAGLGTGVALFLLSQPKKQPAHEEGASVKFDVHAGPGLTYASVYGNF